MLVACQVRAEAFAPAPLPLEEIGSGWTKVTAGHEVCAVSEHRRRWCWSPEQLGDTPEPAPASTRTTALDRQTMVVCRLRDDAVVVCGPFTAFLGYQRPLEIEEPDGSPPTDPRALPVPLPELGDIVLLRTEWHPTGTEICALDSEGEIRCAGPLESLLGAHDALRPWMVREIALPEPAVELQLAAEYACSILASGRVYCWTHGWPVPSPRNDGLDALRWRPAIRGATASEARKIEGFSDARELVVGWAVSCALREHQELSCWRAGSTTAVELSAPAHDP